MDGGWAAIQSGMEVKPATDKYHTEGRGKEGCFLERVRKPKCCANPKRFKKCVLVKDMEPGGGGVPLNPTKRQMDL